MTHNKKIIGTATKPRASVFRSNKNIEVQLIDDTKGVTILSMTSKKIDQKLKPVERSAETGKALAKLAIAKKVTEIVYDRNGYRYHGQVKAMADGLREGGLKF